MQRALLTTPVIDYDPVQMTVTLSNPGGGLAWLVEGQTYEIYFPVPSNPSDIQGLQAIDDATFASPTRIAFAVGAAAGTAPAPEPQMQFCVDILPIFVTSCGGLFCHNSPSQAAMNPDGGGTAAGLVLDNSTGVALTAIGHVAHGSNTGANAGIPESPGTIFGVDMPIIDPGTNGFGDPANSWLLYKVLLAIPSTSDGGSMSQCAPFQTSDYDGGAALPAAMTAERMVLANFILGREMPYPASPSSMEPVSGPGTTPLSVEELERLRLWIKQGAQLETVTVPGPDGGTTSYGTNCSMCAQLPLESGTATPPDASSDAPAEASTDATILPSDAGTNG